MDTSADSAALRRATQTERVIVVTFLLNLLVAAAKMIYGNRARVVALQADGVHSTLDAFANVVGMVGVRFASAPPDAGHPYGHRRFEHLAAAGVGLLILAGLFEVGSGAWDALIHGARPNTGPAGIAVIFGTLAVNVLVTRYEARKATELGSAFLLADSRHTLSDVFATLVVLVSYAAAHAGLAWADPLCAGFVMVLIARAGWPVLRDNVAVLVDAAPLGSERLREVVRAIPGVAGCHKIRSRGSPHAMFVDLHIQVDPSMTVLEGHTLSHRVKDELMQRFSQIEDVLVHLEPDVPEERHD